MKLFFTVIILFISIISNSQKLQKSNVYDRPKLVVGIVIDQMRWDYLYRYYNRYSDGGFKRLLKDGFSCENAMINYLPSYTAVGHSCIFTGSVPSISGIAGNDWINQFTGKKMYCTDDSSVTSVGARDAKDGKMSPRNMLVSTITDELRLATNFKSQVIGVSLKDRASILPAGHLGKAFWLDDESGNFITSTYYGDELPDWVNNFNEQKNIKKLIQGNWETLYPIKSYAQNSSDDDVKWEGLYSNEKKPIFPHNIIEAYEKNKNSFRSTPFGNSLTMALASEAIKSNNLGGDENTDFLTINCASTDYVGHMYGPNSIEIEDTYLRLDKDLSNFLSLLDTKVGKANYIVFLTADHGAAHAINFMKEYNLPADSWGSNKLKDELNEILSEKFGIDKLVRDIMNYQVHFNLIKIEQANADFSSIKKAAVSYLQKQDGITYAIDIERVGSLPIPESIKSMISNGYYYKRSGQIQIVLDAGWLEGYGKTGTTHGSWNPYDIHIPLLWYGRGIKSGQSNKEVYMTDIASTLAAMLHVQMPNGCIGKPILDLLNK